MAHLRFTDISQRDEERVLTGGQILVKELLRELPGILITILIAIEGCEIRRGGCLSIYHEGGGQTSIDLMQQPIHRYI